MDVVVIEVPADTSQKLAIKKIKQISRTGGVTTPIRTYGYIGGKLHFAIGLIMKETRRFGFTHTASTRRGFSGSPIYQDGKIMGIHSRADGAGTNYALSLDFIAGVKEESPTGGKKRHMRELEELAQQYEEQQATEEYDEDEVAWQWQNKQARRAMTKKEAWMVANDEIRRFYGVEEGDRFVTLSQFKWQDKTPMDLDDEDYYEAKKIKRNLEAVNFPIAPNNGGNHTSNGTSSEILKSPNQQTEDIVEISTSSIQEEGTVVKDQPKRKKSKKKRSETGNGPTETSTQLPVASTSTLESSKLENGSPQKGKNKESNPKSWTQVFTQELTSQLGTALGDEEIRAILARAKLVASESFPRDSQSKTSETQRSKEVSDTSSNKTL
jgi:hypothetical protein